MKQALFSVSIDQFDQWDRKKIIISVWRQLDSLKPRSFQETFSRDWSTTHDDLRAYQWTLKSKDRIIRTTRFCSTTVGCSVAQFYADKDSSDRLAVLMLFKFTAECNAAIKLYFFSQDLPHISKFEDERAIIVIPSTLFRAENIEMNECTG